MLGESQQLGQKGKKEIPMPSLRRPHGSSLCRPLMVPISMRNIIRAFQLAPETPPIQHPYSLEHPPPSRGRPPQAPAPTTTRPAGNAHYGVSSNAMKNFPPRPILEFTPIPMTYEDLLSSLIANQIAVITHGKIYQHPFPKWYDPDATCTYHGKTPGHPTEKCLALKYKVQHLIDAR